MADVEAENAATIEDRDKTIRRVYCGKYGGSTAYKTYLDAKAIDPRITLDWVRDWFRENVERTRQVGGAKTNTCRTPCFPRVPNGFVFHHI